MVIATGGDEGCLLAHALLKFKAEYAAIKSKRPVDVCDFEVNMADVDARVD
jgi:hypothetical protein